MAILNEKNDKTKRIIHIMVTTLCLRKCKMCCNCQYDLNDIPYITDEELRNADTICITGGEPFIFSNPIEIARYYKEEYSNIKNIYVYTNATELYEYVSNGGELFPWIDGLSVSIKTRMDKDIFDRHISISKAINELSSNRLYVFDKHFPNSIGNFSVIEREWQEDFVPDDRSIFRKV